MSGRVHVEKRGPLGWIVFDHPERRNAITGEMWREIPKAAQNLDAIARDSDLENTALCVRKQGDFAQGIPKGRQ